ncbi:TPA: hypothetical protein ACK3Q6_002704 [Burkholderia cepacia]|uniref:hypothetical protein n=1 Tax=Burkholderia cepacia TaxID=292 RepID=UPI001CF496E0|nr:hypothetical protein [Burkholderia cepacia]HDR9764009.1 hypothetical protein [Burkholderia cepacia ATCC 25416]MCA8361187.1 hypothetical protein [Burkholderia cepacia]HDR9769801.1 hypothetical protein [Burkholderia cepacia ATCC 25416]HDR9778712.1 hypothetical protein [Burkholderia cepacia ATCC 25416]HDR9787409.1 hypothetical protein [Burkholderia cepacia ATCC 25416]
MELNLDKRLGIVPEVREYYEKYRAIYNGLAAKGDYEITIGDYRKDLLGLFSKHRKYIIANIEANLQRIQAYKERLPKLLEYLNEAPLLADDGSALAQKWREQRRIQIYAPIRGAMRFDVSKLLYAAYVLPEALKDMPIRSTINSEALVVAVANSIVNPLSIPLADITKYFDAQAFPCLKDWTEDTEPAEIIQELTRLTEQVIPIERQINELYEEVRLAISNKDKSTYNTYLKASVAEALEKKETRAMFNNLLNHDFPLDLNSGLTNQSVLNRFHNGV